MDKNKLIDAAAKLVAKGAYDKAIKEYQKALEVDPKDVRILQKLGELFQKKNDNAEAAKYFTKVAESYSADGFFLKAVALYKQVLKLDPNLIEANLKLAELHQQLQLMSEATAYYQIVAAYYEKVGDTRKSLETLKKMVDLDPDNVGSRIRLGELFAKDNLPQPAMAEFKRAADYLKKNNRIDDYMRVAERMSSIDQNDVVLAKELSQMYLQRGDQKRALGKLQVCFKANPQDVDTLKMLASAFLGLGQTAKTISVHKELARIYGEQGKTSESNAAWDQVAHLDPNDVDIVARKKASTPAPAPPSAPSPVQSAPAPAVSKPSAPAAGKESLAKLLTETDVYVKYGLFDKALEHLRRVFEVDAHNIDAHEKAYQIYQTSGSDDLANEQLLNVLRLHARERNAQRAAPFLKRLIEVNPHHPELKIFLQVLSLAPQGPQVTQHAADDSGLLESQSDDVLPQSAPAEVVPARASKKRDEEEVFVNSDVDMSFAKEQSSEIEFDAEFEAQGAEEVSTSAVEVIDELADEELVSANDPAPSVFEPRAQVQPLAKASAPASMAPPAADETSFADAVPTDEDMAWADEKTRGATLAEQPLFEQPVEEHVEAPPEEVVEQGQVYEPPPEPVEEAPVYAEEAQPQQEYVESAPVEEAVESPPEDDPAQGECDEAQFFIEQGLYAEASEILETVNIAYPGHVRAAQLLEYLTQVQAQSQGQEEGESDAFGLAQELASDFAQTADSGEPPAAQGDDFQYSVEEVFAEFKKGLAKVVKPEDVDTHYDLGIAYKEMGLIDDAIQEFVVARQGCPGKSKELDCLTMIGLLQSQKGDFEAAVSALHEALAHPLATEIEKSLRYDLGMTYEQAQKPGKALFQFMRVEALDAAFRDAKGRVQALSKTTKPENDAPGPKASPSAQPRNSPAGARKVGYL